MLPDNPIVLLAAMEIEVKPILSLFRRISENSPKIYEGKIKNQFVYLLISGLGEQSAFHAAYMALEKKPKVVILLGFAGGLNPSLETGKLFIPFQLRTRNGNHHSMPSFSYPFSTEVATGVLLTSSTVIQTKEEKAKLSALGDAVDMESFVIASILEKEKIPFLCIRAILDSAQETLPLDFSSALRHGTISLQEIGKDLLRNPAKIIPLLRLAFRSKKTAKRLCRYLMLVLAGIKSQTWKQSPS